MAEIPVGLGYETNSQDILSSRCNGAGVAVAAISGGRGFLSHDAGEPENLRKLLKDIRGLPIEIYIVSGGPDWHEPEDVRYRGAGLRNQALDMIKTAGYGTIVKEIRFGRPDSKVHLKVKPDEREVEITEVY